MIPCRAVLLLMKQLLKFIAAAAWTAAVAATAAAAGAELRRVAIPSRFTHDVVRVDDSVFVCDTGNGRLLQLSFPDMIPVSCYRRLRRHCNLWLISHGV
jgi:hypothetical protein